MDEIERLENIKQKKKLHKAYGIDVNQKMMVMLETKEVPLSFIADTLSSERESNTINDKSCFFNDVMDIKKEMNFHQFEV